MLECLEIRLPLSPFHAVLMSWGVGVALLDNGKGP
jgi:hypothetical protein